MPRGAAAKARSGAAAAPATPATPAARLREAEAALETGERRQRNGDREKAIGYFQTVCSTVAALREDPHGCLLWAAAMGNLVELGAPSWNETDAPSLHLAASALERGQAAAVGAGALSEELSGLFAARAECATLLRDASSAGADAAAAAQWAGEAARLWEETLAHELLAQRASRYAPEAAVATLCSLAEARMAYGTLALARGAASLGAKARHSAQAAVKLALDGFAEACAQCDSADGDDLADVLAQWARALWDASEVVPPHKRGELLGTASEKAADGVRLMLVPLPETACLLGDILLALGEHRWTQRADDGQAPDGSDVHGAAREALWLLRRALHEGYAAAAHVRKSDLDVVCGTADALMDAGRLQRDMLAHGVDPAEGLADAVAAPPPTAAESSDAAPALAAGIDELVDAAEQMQVEPPLVLAEPPPPPPPPPLPSAGSCLERSALLYSEALGRPAADWATTRVNRVDTAFNAACVCALRGDEEGCARLLGALAAEGALTRAEVEQDCDLQPLVAATWMQRLLHGLPA